MLIYRTNLLNPPNSMSQLRIENCQIIGQGTCGFPSAETFASFFEYIVEDPFLQTGDIVVHQDGDTQKAYFIRKSNDGLEVTRIPNENLPK